MRTFLLHASSSSDSESVFFYIFIVLLIGIAVIFLVRNYEAIKAWLGFLDDKIPAYQANKNTHSNHSNHFDTLRTLEGEKIIKDYFCSKLAFPKCEGHLTVTDRRVIFHGSSKNSRVVDEVKIETVSAISSFYGGRFRPLILIVGIALTLSGLMMFFGGLDAYYLRGQMLLLSLLILAMGIVALYFSYKKVFYLKVYSSEATGSPISIGEGYGGLGGNSAVFSIIGSPTPETDQMMLELGKVIFDLQTMGDNYEV